MTNLAELSVIEGASLALEVLAYGEWDNQKNHSWRTAREGSFEDYLQQLNDEDYDYDDEETTEEKSINLDNSHVWQEFMSTSNEGTRDNLTAKVVAEYGGEGQGDQYWMVVSISDGTTTRYFRRDGWYASYDGGTLDGETYEVKPQERLITFYE